MATWQSAVLSVWRTEPARRETATPVNPAWQAAACVDTHAAVGGVVMSAGRGAPYAHLLLQGQELLIHLREW